MSGPGPAIRAGIVLTFDAPAGYGTVGAGDESWFFHCTSIADGSRSIAEGTAVRFRITAGHRGRWEAVDLILG